MAFLSYAQNFEDVLLWRALREVEAGFYVDAGASHPDADSVTRAFYDRGWRGINVEPAPDAFARLAAARLGDVNLHMALGRAAGTQEFHVVEGGDTGLSTLDAAGADRLRALGIGSRPVTVAVDTLAAICARHAPAEIHFLKVDVEGHEQAVLEGADFARFRPWIVLVEATAPMSTAPSHAGWEPILLGAGYRFAWFDGLNRFYVAVERAEQLLPRFGVPPNVFDDFLRAADGAWAGQLARAEGRAEAALARAVVAEGRVAVAEHRATAAALVLARSSAEAAGSAARAAAAEREAARRSAALDGAAAEAADLRDRAERAEAARRDAEGWLAAMRGSTSWRLTGPLRRALRALGRSGAPVVAVPTVPAAPIPEPPTPPSQAHPLRADPLRAHPLRAVHQFHSGTAVGDAVTNAMLLTRGLLRRLGYESHIFAEHRPPELQSEIHGLDALPERDEYALIVRHSMGHDALDRILALPAPRVLFYHNITPPELLEDNPVLADYARKGRAQLEPLRRAVAASLADSVFNALELHRAGFAAPVVCPLLFDVGRMGRAAPPSADDGVFTILFVGRLTRSKGQVELVEAFAHFRLLYGKPTQLVLIGRSGGDPYAAELSRLVHRLGLGHGAVHITGPVSDEALWEQYARADLYVSLSAHEGFGVPLVEAMAQGVPVLAFPAGAVPYTLGGAGRLLADRAPASVAAAMLAMAEDAAARRATAADQRRSLERWRLERHVPTLLAALARAGVPPPPEPSARAALAANMRFTVAGHVNGSYSLAEVNRSLAAALEAARPGAVRLLPVEGAVSTDLSRVPAGQREATEAFATRPAPATAPHVVISQHYPVWVPFERGDLALAYVFWEESLLPAATVAALNAGFDGVLAPSRAVAKALIDSGVSVPVRAVGAPARLDAFAALAATPRAAAPFTFLHVSSGFPRKGVDVLLAAWAQAFRAGDPVRLVIKTFPNPHNDVAVQLGRLRAADPDLAPVELVDADLDEPALLALYAGAHAAVLPTRGEGLNLPAAEALAAGLRLIVTGHGGHMDILADAPAGAVRFVRYAFAPARTHLSTPFSLWAEPDREDLAQALREVAAAGAAPAFRFDGGAVAERVIEAAAGLLLRPAPAAPKVAPRIAMLTTWDVPCGVAGYAGHLARHLPGVELVLADRRTAAGSEGELRVVPTWEIGGEDFHALSSALVRFGPDAVLLQHQPGLIPWSTLAKLLALPALDGRVVCITLHNSQSLLALPAAEGAAAVAALRRCSRVAVHTLADVNRLSGLGLEANVVLIPQGVPEATTPQAPVPAVAAPTIGCYGFFLPDKGIAELIEALPAIRAVHPSARLRLVCAEYPAPGSAAAIADARARAASLGLTDAVEFHTGFLDEARSTALLAGCDLLVLPYQRSNEASSAALRSAMAAGVAAAVTDLPLFAEAGDAVARLPGTAPAALAQGIIELLAAPERRRALVEQAGRWRAPLLWPAVAARWAGMLTALVRSGVVIGRDDGPDPLR